MVAARDLGEARLAQRRHGVLEALEHEHVDVGHRPLRLDAADRLRHDRALHGQRPDPARAEPLDAARGEGDLPECPHEKRAPLVGEPWLELGGPRRVLAIERREQQRRETLLASRFEHGLGAEVRRQRGECAGNHELAHVGPRL